VSDAILAALPVSRMIQIRTPYYKQNMYGTGATGTGAALPSSQAHNGTVLARTGHHNDCFLASPDDYGTYLDIPNDKNYLEAETLYLLNGGETCNDNSTYTNCTNAVSELQRFHFSYLNNDYNATVLTRWVNEGCFNDVKKKLGYRFYLTNGSFTSNGKQGRTFNLNVNVTNEGYAAPANHKKVELVLKNTANSTSYKRQLSLDPRLWLSNTTTNINTSVGIGNIPDGNYDLYLSITDTFSSIASNPLFAVRFANASGVWDATGGYNKLFTINVNNSNNPGTPSYTGSSWLGPPVSTLPISFLQTNAFHTPSSHLVQWEVIESISNIQYEVERSLDGISFRKVASVAPRPADGANITYEALLEKINEPSVYYRIKQIDANGKCYIACCNDCKGSWVR
jgi:hypothetical protein